MSKQVEDQVSSEVVIEVTHEVDSTEKVLRFGCGALFAISFSVYSAIDLMFDESGFIFILFMLMTIIVFGFLAMKYGNRFWYSLKEFL